MRRNTYCLIYIYISWPAASTTSEKKEEKKSENDINLFGDDDEDDEEWQNEIQRRADEHAKKKEASGKKLIAKSAIVIDVKPWEDTTPLDELEKQVRAIAMDGLEWKACKYFMIIGSMLNTKQFHLAQLVEIGYGIKKLQISCHVEDDKVSVDDVQEKIEDIKDFVQSTDIVTFTKL